MKFICICQYFFVPLQRLLVSKPFSYSGQPFQESSQKFTIFKIPSQLSSQPFSGLVSIYARSASLESLVIPWRFLGGSLVVTLPKAYQNRT